MKEAIAVVVSILVALKFISSGWLLGGSFSALFVPWERDSTTMIRGIFLTWCIVSGVGILFRDSWAFYSAYGAFAFRIISYYIPLLRPAMFSFFYTTTLLQVGALIWAHRTLAQSKMLDDGFLSNPNHREADILRNIRLASAVFLTLSIILATYSMIGIDTRAAPGGMGGGVFGLLILEAVGPLAIICFATLILSHLRLKNAWV